MQRIRVQMNDPAGLRAQPANEFVNTAAAFRSDIKVRNASVGSAWVNAKNLLGVVELAVEQGNDVELSVEGPDEREAARALGLLVDRNPNERR